MRKLPNVVPLFIFDRDEYAPKALASLKQKVGGLDDRMIVVDDRQHKLGFAGAIQEGWSRLLALDPLPDYVFHMEGDFVFHEEINARRLARILERNPHLIQVALRRQAWNADERTAGGVVELQPDAYEQWADQADYWLEHRLFFTTNPSVYRLDLCRQGWPQTKRSEGIFTHRMIGGPDGAKRRFAYYGRREDVPVVEHIGVERAGFGY